MTRRSHRRRSASGSMGRWPEWLAAVLIAWLASVPIILSAESLRRFLGARDDVPDLMNGFDIFVMSSISESFPNVLAEAMATALPCISTHVGDCARVLGDRNFIVPPRAPEALSASIINMKKSSKEQRAAIGAQNRARVIANYTPSMMIKAFDQIFEMP